MSYDVINVVTEDLIQNYDNKSNYFDIIPPKEIVIMDSYNNDFYPYRDIILDKNTYDLPKYKRFLEKQFGSIMHDLPFHFFMELVNDEYYIYNTRMMLLKPMFLNEDNTSKKYKNSIIFVILGDSNTDLYNRFFYEKLKRFLKSISILFKWGNDYRSNVVFHNIGKHFHIDKLFT